MTASAQLVSLSATPTRRSLRRVDGVRASDTRLAATLIEILERPAKGFFELPKECQCRECRSIRRAPYRCAACGFDGVPLVEPCDCRRVRADWLTSGPRILAEIDAGTSKGYGRGAIPFLKADIEKHRALPDRMCRASADPAVRERRARNCGHGMTWCPTCASMDGSETPNVEVPTLVELVRDLRAAIQSHTAFR